MTQWWIRYQLPIAGQHIRQDRILAEAEADATGGDIRALCDFFGIWIASAYRYSAIASTGYGAGPEPAGK